MKNYLQKFWQFTKNQKKKIFVVCLLTLIWVVVIFPYSDLGDFISSKISDATSGQVSMTFEDLGFGMGPSFQPAINMKQVVFEMAGLSTIKADNASIAPWFTGLLLFRKGVEVNASGIFNGSLVARVHEGEKTKSGIRKSNVALQANQIELNKLSYFLRQSHLLGLELAGFLSGESEVLFDPSFESQPDGLIDIIVNNFLIPGQNVASAMGPMQIPSIRFSQLAVKSSMKEGRMDIQNFILGNNKDDVYGKISGELTIAMNGRHGAGIGNYNLKIDLQARKSFLDANQKNGVGLVFLFLQKFQQPSEHGTRVAFQMKGSGNASPPELTPLNGN